MKTAKGTNKVALAIKKVVDIMAKASFGAASIWGIYQIKEPKVHK